MNRFIVSQNSGIQEPTTLVQTSSLSILAQPLAIMSCLSMNQVMPILIPSTPDFPC